ncbi:hypothetical protein ABFS83_09G007400 [Erythranthe nasuta]
MMKVKRVKKKNKLEGKGKYTEIGDTIHKDDSWLAIQGFASLKRKLKKAQDGMLKAKKTYDTTVNSLTYVEIGVRVLHNFARFIMTNKKDVRTTIEIKEELSARLLR